MSHVNQETRLSYKYCDSSNKSGTWKEVGREKLASRRGVLKFFQAKDVVFARNNYTLTLLSLDGECYLPLNYSEPDFKLRLTIH